MGISPLTPWLLYVLVFRAPFNLNLKLPTLNRRCLIRESEVITGCMVRLAITG